MSLGVGLRAASRFTKALGTLELVCRSVCVTLSVRTNYRPRSLGSRSIFGGGGCTSCSTDWPLSWWSSSLSVTAFAKFSRDVGSAIFFSVIVSSFSRISTMVVCAFGSLAARSSSRSLRSFFSTARPMLCRVALLAGLSQPHTNVSMRRSFLVA